MVDRRIFERCLHLCVTCLVYFGCSLDGLTNHAFQACRRRPRVSSAYRKTISRNLAAVVNSSAAERYGALAWFGWGRRGERGGVAMGR